MSNIGHVIHFETVLFIKRSVMKKEKALEYHLIKLFDKLIIFPNLIIFVSSKAERKLMQSDNENYFTNYYTVVISSV